MKRNRQIAISLLIAVTVIYAVALLQSIQAYEDWKRNKLEEYPAEVRPWMDFYPYFLSKQGAPCMHACNVRYVNRFRVVYSNGFSQV